MVDSDIRLQDKCHDQGWSGCPCSNAAGKRGARGCDLVADGFDNMRQLMPYNFALHKPSGAESDYTGLFFRAATR